MRKANIALLTSTHLRHRYVANKINDFFNLKVIVKEDKGNAYQHKGSNHSETQVLRDHFQSLADSEQRFFSDSKWPTDCLTINLERGSINSERVLNALLGAKCDYVAVFGCGIINDDIISQFNGRIINAHQGLSPYYRGSATNFWPFVNNELQFVGVTMHYIDKGIDTGNIICHGRPSIDPCDNIHDIGCKVVLKTADLFCSIFSHLELGHSLIEHPQKVKGTLYQRKDFNADAVLIAQRNIKEGSIARYSQEKDQKFSDLFFLLEVNS